MAGTLFFKSCDSSFSCSSNSTLGSQKWIVDSGASQHMTSSDSLLRDTLNVSKFNLFITHPNRTSTKIEKIGNMNISKSSTQLYVFAIPEFNINLLSVHKLCKDSKYEVVSNEHNCKIQGLQSKWMVENGRESGGLYYFDSVP